MEAFRWLQEFLGLVVKLIPRPRIIRSTHGAVAFVRGKPRRVNSGCWYWYWPIWTEIEETPIVIQTKNLKVQGVMACDAKGELVPVSVSGVVQYTITDIYSAVTKLWDIDTQMEDLGQAAVVNALWDKHLEVIYSDRELIMEEIKAELIAKVGQYGIQIENIFINTLTTAHQFNIMGIPEEIDLSMQTTISKDTE